MNMFNASNLTSYSTQIINSTTAPVQDRSFLFWLRITAICTLMICVVVGNLMVLYCLLTIKEMRTVTGLFLTNLAVTDLGVGLISLPLSLASNIDHYLLHSNWFCVIEGLTLLLFVIASLLTLGVLSIQKYVNVGYSTQRRFTKRVAKYMIGGVWIIAALFAMGPAFGWSKYTYSTGGHQCAPYTNSLSGQIYIILLLVICIITPSAVMLYCYSKLYIMIHKHVHRVPCNEATSENSQTRTLSTVESHMIQTLIIMMIVFFICWLPTMIIVILMTMNAPISKDVEVLSMLCASGNSAVNPILYAMRQKDFQRGFRQIIRRICLKCQLEDSNQMMEDGGYIVLKRTNKNRAHNAGD